jgi:beta-lactamase regulating signal transducer with metallopeptidase domain
MGTCLQIGLTNALWAAVLAVFVAAVTRVWRNPHLAHALWLIVLLRLVAPPLFQVPLQTPAWLTRAIDGAPPSISSDAVSATRLAHSDLERSDTKSAPSRVAKTGENARSNSVLVARALEPVESLPKSTVQSTPQATTNPSRVPSPGTPSSVARSISLLDIGAGLWICGSAFYLVVTVVRVRRFGRAIGRFRSLAPDWLADEIAELSGMVGLRRSPRLAVVEVALPPMVWSGWRPTLLLPKTIVESLDPSQRRLLLLHELWHVRRGDHRTRWFAVAVLALYWWNPAAWWAVRRLQNAEEECCDAAVLSLQPQPEAYGEALLAVSEFVSCGSLPAAAVSIGVERKNHLKRRMTMILKGSRWPRLSKGRLAVVAVGGALAIGVSLTTAAAQVESASEAKSTPKAEPDKAGAPRPAPVATRSAPSAKKRYLELPSTPAPLKLPALLSNDRLQPSAADNETQKTLKERYNAAIESAVLFHKQYEMGAIPLGSVLASGRRAMEAKLALAKTPREQSRAVADYHVLAMYCWKEARARLDAGAAGSSVPADEAQAREAISDAALKYQELHLPKRSKAVAATAALPPQSAKEATPTGSEVLAPAAQNQSLPHGSRSAGQLPALLTAKPLEPEAGDPEMQKLLKQRYNSALKSLQSSYLRATVDSTNRLTSVITPARTLLDAELAITAPKEMPVVYQRYLELWKYLDNFAEKRWNDKTIGADEFNAVHEARLDAEIKWMSAKDEFHAFAQRSKSRIQALETNVRIANADFHAAQAGVGQAEADLRRAQANFKLHDRNWQRLHKLQNGVAQQALDEAQRDRDVDEANIDGAKAAIMAAQAQVEIKRAQLQKAEDEFAEGKASLEK